MKDDRARLERLSTLAGLRSEVESAELAAANAEIRALQLQVTTLRSGVRLRDRAMELDPSRMSGADLLWVRRTEQQITGLQARIAAAMIRRDEAQQAARQAVGRAQAVNELLQRNRKAQRSD